MEQNIHSPTTTLMESSHDATPLDESSPLRRWAHAEAFHTGSSLQECCKAMELTRVLAVNQHLSFACTALQESAGGRRTWGRMRHRSPPHDQMIHAHVRWGMLPLERHFHASLRDQTLLLHLATEIIEFKTEPAITQCKKHSDAGINMLARRD